MVGDALLWSPANTGPLSITNQVLTVHDLGSLEHPEWYNAKFAAWYRWLLPKLIKRVRRVITISRFSQERLVAVTGAEQSKITVVPGGVDVRFHPRDPSEIALMRAKVGIPSPHYILTLGAMEPRKNLRRLLAAWGLCVSRLPKEVWLVVAGASAPSNVFRPLDMGDIPPRVHFAGSVSEENLPALYSGALAFAYVSVYEGFGLPALEAMAAGTVPIVAGNSSLPEVVGDAGLHVNPYEVEQIASAIQRLINDSQLRDTLTQRAAAQSSLFKWERTAALTWKVLCEVQAS
jgi:glycosyltransferase involved in cell wall biosynthesis